ncbi:MAG: tetratricopeptide repeat protein [Nakamurella sp.]
MRPRLVAIVLSVVLVAYFVLIFDKAMIFFTDGTPVTIGLGIGTLLLPLVGAVLLFFELRFGWRTQQLGRRLGEEGGLPEQPDLPTRPSGRIDKAAALPHFERARVEAADDPANWRVWFRLADAYDLAGDRKRARAAMRKAIELETSDH